MSENLTVYFSNRVESLYERLKKKLFFDRKKNPFIRRLIVVPSPAIKSWLMLRMANDPDLKIACGIEIIFLDQAIEIFRETHVKFPTSLELALAIEIEIRQILKNWPSFDLVEKSYWQPLLDYLKVREKLTRKNERRLISLSQKLADLFQKYGIHGGEIVKEWEVTPLHWQAKIWEKIYKENRFGWSYPANALTAKPILNCEVHLFPMSFLAKIYHDFFFELAKEVPTQIYLLSPCQMFWSDLHSDKEKNRLLNYWKKQRVSNLQQEALEEYLRDRNALLANFGRLGREMAHYVEERECLVEDDYIVSDVIKNHLHYQEFWFDELILEKSEFTFLKAIQADMTLLRTPEIAHKMEKTRDNSIELHIVSSRMREVEVVYNRLLGIIEKHQSSHPITPSDIIVMAPNIAEYESFIKNVFGSSESQLDYQIMDLSLSFQDDVIKGFLHLITLPLGRRDSISLMQLLECNAFREHHHFSEDDVKQIRAWTSQADIRWGYDSLDRQEILQRDHCATQASHNYMKGTWEAGFNYLLESLIIENSSEEKFSFPSENVEMTQAELLGKWIKIIQSLKSDLKILQDETLTLRDWESYLKALIEAYFGINDLEKDSILIKQIENIQKVSLGLSTEKFSFSSLREYLERSLRQQHVSFRESHLQSVRFCSLMPMRAIPSQVIFLIGMHEENFPRKEQFSSLDLLQNHPKASYYPTQTDLDRYLFLEALLSTRQYFFMSYVGYDGNGKEVEPSLVVSELLTYINQAFTNPIEVMKHSFHAFDKKYFNDEEPYKSYSLMQYKNALAFYSSNKKMISPMVEEFSIKQEVLVEKTVITISEIVAFAANPLKSYFNKSLGIYLKEEEKEFKIEDDFAISLLDLSKAKKMTLKAPLEEVITLANKEGIIPEGAFKNVSIEKLVEESKALKANLSKFDLQSKDIFQLKFSQHIEKPIQDEKGNWWLPSLNVSPDVKIEGSLSEASLKGLVVHLKDDKVDVFKAWPQFLLFCYAVDYYQLPFEKKLLFAKSGKIKEFSFENVEKPLEKYLNYFFISKSNLSPLIPDWGSDLIYQSPEKFEKNVQAHLNNDFKPIYNPYLKWMIREKIPLNIQSMSRSWSPLAKEVFLEMLENWYPNKSKGVPDEVL